MAWVRELAQPSVPQALLPGPPALHRVRLIVQLDDFLRHINAVRGINNRRILRRRIKHRQESAFPRVTVQHIHHLPSDPVHHVALRRIHVFLHLVLFAVQLLRQLLALRLRPGFLLVAPGRLVRGQLLPQIIDLLVERFQFILPRRKLRLQFRRSLFPFRRRDDGLSHVQNCDLSGACSRAGCSLGPEPPPCPSGTTPPSKPHESCFSNSLFSPYFFTALPVPSRRTPLQLAGLLEILNR